MYHFKIADTRDELSQIHTLNHQVFCEEIGQYETNKNGLKIDRFHKSNTYLIALLQDKVIAMVSINFKRPFSLDAKLPGLDHYLPAHRNCAEVRLLVVKPEHRRTRVVPGLLDYCRDFCLINEIDLLLISGILQQQPIYKRLGFKPFAYKVGKDGVVFQPMLMKIDTETRATEVKGFTTTEKNFLPGPVPIAAETRRMLSLAPVPHRSPSFKTAFGLLRNKLCQLTRARGVHVFAGGGTLANDMVAAQLSTLAGRGLILSNGEFGKRLIDHADRQGLAFEAMNFGWGQPFNYKAIGRYLKQVKPEYIWFTHCETSTGILNDLELLTHLANKTDTKVCVDCVSTIGAISLDLSQVYLASASSGKALSAVAGLGMVFGNHFDKLAPNPFISRSLDLALYEQTEGVAFTITSTLVFCLLHSLSHRDWLQRYESIQTNMRRLLDYLQEHSIAALADQPGLCAPIVSIPLPEWLPSVVVGKYLKQVGIDIHYHSRYLKAHNIVQIACMGDYQCDDLLKVARLIKNAVDLRLNKLQPRLASVV